MKRLYQIDRTNFTVFTKLFITSFIDNSKANRAKK